VTIVASGVISINSLVGEYGGSTPHSMNEYYKGGSLVLNHSNNANVPTSGTIQLDDFYSQNNAQPFDASIAGTASSTSFGGKDFSNNFRGVNTKNTGGISAPAYGSWSDDDFTNTSGGTGYEIMTVETITGSFITSGCGVKVQVKGDHTSSSSFFNAFGWRYIKNGTTIIFDSNQETSSPAIASAYFTIPEATTFNVAFGSNTHANLMPNSGTFTLTLSN